MLSSHVRKEVWRYFLPKMVHWFKDITEDLVFFFTCPYAPSISVFRPCICQNVASTAPDILVNTLLLQFIDQNCVMWLLKAARDYDKANIREEWIRCRRVHLVGLRLLSLGSSAYKVGPLQASENLDLGRFPTIPRTCKYNSLC